MLHETNDIDRQRIIDAHIAGRSVATIAELLCLRRTTVYGIIRTYRNEDRVRKLLRGGPRNKKLQPEHKDRIREFVDDDCSITLRSLKEKCLQELHVSVCEKTIDRCLKEFHCSFKRTHNLPQRRNDENTIRVRAQYAEHFMQLQSELDETKFIFIDEVGFSLSMRCKRWRSARGTRAVHVVNGLRTKNMSACCAMSRNGIIKHTVQPRAFNKGTFKQFIEEICVLIGEQGL